MVQQERGNWGGQDLLVPRQPLSGLLESFTGTSLGLHHKLPESRATCNSHQAQDWTFGPCSAKLQP